MRKYKDLLYWDIISGYQKLTLSFIKEFEKLIDFEQLSYSEFLTEDIVRVFNSKLDMDLILKNLNNYDFSESFKQTLKTWQ